MYDDYFDGHECDDQLEELKSHLYTSVKQQIADDLKRLRTENAEMRTKLADLDKLTRETEWAKQRYERDIESAKREAKSEVQKASFAEMLKILVEPTYVIERKHVARPKCGKCDDRRRIQFVKPSGTEDYELCRCYHQDIVYEVDESWVKEVSRYRGEFNVFYRSVKSTSGDRDDYISSDTYKKNARDANHTELLSDPARYHFDAIEQAQSIADELNTKNEQKR